MNKINQPIKNWYENNALNYHQSQIHKIDFEEIDQFLSYLPTRPQILDLGCAGGRDCQIFYEKGCRIIGLDFANNFIKLAKNNYPKIKFIHANFLNIPLKNESIDGVWAHASLVHLQEDNEINTVLKEIYRVLRIKGFLFLSLKKKFQEKNTKVYRYYSAKEIKKFLKNNNFKLIKTGVKNSSRQGIKWLIVYAQK